MATIQGIYIALFGRPADPLGLAYFNEETNNGADLSAIGDLSATNEYQDRFSGLNNVQIVTRIYQELFGRDPDAAGLAFFVAQLNSGAQNINTIAINILDGAQGDDLATVNNKIAAANLFTAEIDTAIEVGSYVGDEAADAGRDYLNGVTEDAATVPTEAEAEAAVQAIVDAGVAGNTFNVAAGGSVVVGDGANNSTNDNDTINVTGNFDAVAGSINGGLGFDTVNADLASGAVTVSATDLQNVERFNVRANGGAATSLDIAAVVGLQELGIQGSASGLNDLTVTGIEAGTDVTLAAGTLTGNALINLVYDDVAGTADARTITVESSVDQQGTLTVAGVETLTLDIEGPATLGNLNALDSETVTITGTGNLVIENLTLDTDATIDGSAHVGSLSVINGFGAFPENDITIIGGGSNDSFTIIDNSEGVTLTGNAGADLFTVGALTNLDTITDDEIAADLISITDFNGAEDVLDVTLTGAEDVFNNVENANVSGAADLGAALAAAGNATSVSQYSIFEFQGATYVYQNDAVAGLSSGDGVIELVGFTGELTASNFI